MKETVKNRHQNSKFEDKNIFVEAYLEEELCSFDKVLDRKNEIKREIDERNSTTQTELAERETERDLRNSKHERSGIERLTKSNKIEVEKAQKMGNNQEQ